MSIISSVSVFITGSVVCGDRYIKINGDTWCFLFYLYHQLNTVNVDIFADFRILAISRGSNFAFLILLLLCSIIKVISTMYIFSRTFDKRE